MKVITVNKLKVEKANYEKLLAEQRQLLSTTQVNVIRLEGALAYIDGSLAELQTEEKPDG